MCGVLGVGCAFGFVCVLGCWCICVSWCVCGGEVSVFFVCVLCMWGDMCMGVMRCGMCIGYVCEVRVRVVCV